MSWRDRYVQIIAKVLAANSDKTVSEKRKALRAAFPDGPREYHPYKIWLDECRVQMGLKPVKTPKKGVPKVTQPAAGQRDLFSE